MSKYQLVREIGRGGMGCVYEGIGPDGIRVAVKMMNGKITANPEYKELFYAEAEALRKMHHPSVVRIVDNPFADAQGNLYLPMEFVKGETIEHLVEKKGRMQEAEAVDLMGKILDAMAYVHSMACIHRDIKPSNIMVKGDGSVCIIDFGIAKDMKTHTGKTIGRIIGTDGYMSPEQATGVSIDHRTDIYSLGCLLFFMVTGTTAIPKRSNDYETVCAILNTTFPDPKIYNTTLSNHLQQVILKAVDKNMLHRYQTAMDFKQALYATGTYSTAGGHTTAGRQRVAITIGRSPDNDYVCPSNYVSGRHADIEYRECLVTGENYSRGELVYTDHSTNGTSVNGRYVHNESISLYIPVFVPASSTRRMVKVEIEPIWLAGKQELCLDTDKVLKLLYAKWEKAKQDTSTPPPPPPQSQPNGRQTVHKANGMDVLTVVACIVCFICPLAILVFALLWRRKKNPKREKVVGICAFAGFIFWMIYNQVIAFL